MCTNIASTVAVSGSGRNAGGWFDVDHAYVSYDHPFHAQMEHALNIDFVNKGAGPGARVGVELTLDSARQLAQALLASIAAAEAWEAGGG